MLSPNNVATVALGATALSMNYVVFNNLDGHAKGGGRAKRFLFLWNQHCADIGHQLLIFVSLKFYNGRRFAIPRAVLVYEAANPVKRHHLMRRLDVHDSA